MLIPAVMVMAKVEVLVAELGVEIGAVGEGKAPGGVGVPIPDTLNDTALLVPFEFCTYTVYVPGVISCMYMAHIIPGAQYGPTADGTVKVSV